VSPHYLRLVAFVIPPTMPLGSAYDVEGWRGNDRHHFNAIVQIPDLVDYYWQPFKACVQEAKAGSIMCSCAYAGCCASVPAAMCAAVSRYRQLTTGYSSRCWGVDNAVNGTPSW
jgi:hypothetical protein